MQVSGINLNPKNITKFNILFKAALDGLQGAVQCECGCPEGRR